MRRKLRILIADDHRLMLAAVRRVLAAHDDIVVVAEAASGEAVVELAAAARPDVVLLDVNMPGMDGIECVRRLRLLLPGIRIVMLSAYADETSVSEAERAGADGYVLKSIAADELVQAIRAAGHSEGLLLVGFPEREEDADLTVREQAILQAASDGLTNGQIARLLWITDQTVRFHLQNVRRKLGASNREEAIRLARERGAVRRLERRPAGV